jgi:hypothetical protein
MSDDINRDLEAQLAMWTNFQFPSSSTLPPPSSANLGANPDNDEDERIFSPERDTASRSRHKAIPVEDFTSGHFFGNVGASLSHPATSHAAAYERAKFQQLQQQLLHQNNNNDNPHPSAGNGNIGGVAAGDMGMGGMGDNHEINELFSFLPNDDMDLNPTIVDPFLNPSDIAAGGGYGNQLPPLTIRHPTHGRPHPQLHSVFPSHLSQLQMQQQQQQTIDPATTTLNHRVTLPLPSTTPSMKRQQKKGSVSRNVNLIIPVDHDYTAPSSAIRDDDMDHDHHHDSNNVDGTDGMDGVDDFNALRELDASGKPIPYSASEDKRRRNTLASARFRQKKKEREAAMEKKARELDERVAGLERECESLRKENRMLRGLLVDGVPVGVAPSNNNSNSATTSSTSAEDISPIDGKNVIGAGASVVLLEELVRLLKANGAVLNKAPGQQATPMLANGRTATTTGKRKRGGGN